MRAILTIAAGAIVVAGCRAKEQQESSGDVARETAATPALAVTQASWAPDALDELVAPIALYPDQLLGQILAASVNAQEVLDAGNWLLQNENLKGDQLDAAAQKAGFGAAARALVHFPTVVDMMCQEIDWTRQVGAAFTSDQKAVLDAVQRLRAQAADVGNLTSTPQQTVERKTEGGEAYVEVKPADPKVVYVPQYDPEVIYTTPPPSAPAAAPTTTTTTTTTSEGTVSTGAAVAGGLLAFGVGMLIGSALDDDDYCYPHWGAGAVYYGPRPFYPPAYVYRPVYGPAFRPAYGYAPRPGYRYSYNSGNNIVINNNNYYNRFNNQQNLRVGARNPAAATRQAGAGNRAGQSGRGENWRGQPTYAGGRGGANQRSASTNDRRPGTAEQQRTAAAGRANQPAAARNTRSSQTPARSASRPNDRATPATRDRGYGATSTPAPTRDVASSRAAQPRTQPNATREQPRTQPSATREQPREHALSGASQKGTGSFDRAASARGNASAPAARQTASRGGRRQ